MEKIINILSEIEEKAATILSHTSEEKQQLHDQLEADLQDLDDKIAAKTDQKIAKIHASFDDSINAERNSLIKTSDEQISRLENDFSTNHDILVEKVFQSIIGA